MRGNVPATAGARGALRVTLLGTGSPTPSPARRRSAALVQWGERSSLLVDAGDGVVFQLLAAGLDVAAVEEIAFTHLHWDHILGYPAFVWGSWCAGRSRLRVVGPRGTADMHRRLVKDFYREQAEWAIGLGFERAGWDAIEVLDVEPGWSATRAGCVIETARVVHPPMEALAYRFADEGRTLVVSGDTARCQELVSFARGADLLVVDACAIRERLREFHASPPDCVGMAAEADVRRVVLTHHLPAAHFELGLAGYDGEVLVGNDLDVLAA